MAEENEPEAELPYDCPLCGARNSPLKNMGPIPIPERPTVINGEIKFAPTMLYECINCRYMVFIRD